MQGDLASTDNVGSAWWLPTFPLHNEGPHGMDQRDVIAPEEARSGAGT
jgi:hypothetical protein